MQPIYKDNFDFVSPTYRRQKFTGVLMRNLLYPMTRAIYGYGVREPYATEFAVSSRLASDFLNKDGWNGEWNRSVEILLTVTAITGKYRTCQSFLGAKPQDRSATDLVEAMRATVELYSLLSIAISSCGARFPAVSPCPPSAPSRKSPWNRSPWIVRA